jgi:acyl-coenzyme A synthetase/AMP-(fatty) acid ligase
MTRQPGGVPRIDMDGGYDRFHADFRWSIPQTFNFGVDVVDRMAREADGPALIAENQAGDIRRFSYSDIARLTNQLANVLAAQGIGKGDFIIVMLPRIPEWQIATVAALKLGAVPIPCIEMLTPRDLAYRAENSGAKAVICRGAQAHKFADIGGALKTRIALSGAPGASFAPGWLDYEAEMAKAATSFAAPAVKAEDPAIMYYTSGSTGHPKGVLHASRGLYSWWVSAAYWLDLNPGDTIWCTADTGWSKAGTSILFGPWARGACSLIYDGPFDPAVRLRLIGKHKVSVYCAPATELFRLADEDIARYDLSRLRQTVSAGEAVSPVIAGRWRAATGLPISEAYGLTETLMLALNYPGEPVKPGSMGRPIPGARVEIVGPDGEVMPLGEEGDIAVLAPHPQIMLGYWREPERTEACYRAGSAGRWFISGDRGARDEDGYIWYRGRADDIINSAGYRIGPMEVENALLDHPAVAECAVVGKPDARRGEIVKAFVLLRPGYGEGPAMVEALQEHCKAQTAPYKYPREIAFLDEIPKTLTGKIRRSELRDRERRAGA